MSETAIEWTERSWNPVVGCSIVSPGCTNCYAMKMADRLEAMAPQPSGEGNPHLLHYRGTTTRGEFLSKPPVWTGKVALAPEHVLLEPLRRRKPTTWFVNSMGDLFHEDVPDNWIDRVLAVMALCPQHTFQVLTKRADRMHAYCSRPGVYRRVGALMCDMAIDLRLDVVLIAPGTDERQAPSGTRVHLDRWPLPNVWLGVSAEDQRRAEERIPELLATPAAIRFVSAEPLLGPIDFEPWLPWADLGREVDGKSWGCQECDTDCSSCPNGRAHYHVVEGPPDAEGCPEWITADRVTLDWIIVGGESGSKARPMHPDWARSIRDQCAAAGTAFFFKQWGEWAPGECCGSRPTRAEDAATFYDENWDSPGWHYERITARESEQMHRDDEPDVYRIGKKRAGRLLDGVEHNAMPEA